jgi:uncharacterized membrane protein
MIQKKYHKITITLFVFAIIYSSIAFVNHYLFRTYALDLGLYTNALFDYSHFQWNDSSTFKIDEQNLLADHFDLYLILFSPFSFILGTYTLQFIQIIALLLGALGVYQFGKSFFKNQQLVWLATLHFLLFFGCFAAVAFDYHSNVVAACVLPWFFLPFKKVN